ncbi:bifunctional serine/threonine-protein kinase/formylglycine-generating enzyme family protein [Engelhardtia mirabilis]|uniref:Serine/threonine-protein kinase PrkC n=1 Tax=Engelhardtia mirabilis TaxID=2528011 RepID=A0A518BQ54_9BACT|nr:Serine/threonine-protein kinase PrkC [Planctomycetes bacterium Pla133]QDV03417.1 Serine/threonine-protein kinase PrkC [Planctomycetes bacterium Pla86]
MNDESTESSASPGERLVASFLAAHPDGDREGFEAWIAVHPEARVDADLTSAARAALEAWHDAGRLLAAALPAAAYGPSDSPVGPSNRGGGGGPAPRAFAQGDRLAHFTLGAFVARGGMGQVWQAFDENLRRVVALKLVLPERVEARSLELFAREARAGGRLSHPNIVRTLDFGRDEGVAWIAQDLIDGGWDLKGLLAKICAAEVVPPGYYRRAAEIVAQLADGLGAAHGLGVIHRDVKPANVLLDTNAGDGDVTTALTGTPKLTDFGLARIKGDSFPSFVGELAGTWAYMSPEQVRRKRAGLDERTDIFSLGVVLYELLALRRPFDGDTVQQIADQILNTEPPRPSRVRSRCPEELAVICGKALEKEPQHRYQTAAEFAKDLRRFLEHRPIHARPARLPSKVRKFVRRHPTASAAGSIGALGALALILVGSNAAIQARIADRRWEEIQSLSALEDLRDLERVADQLWPITGDRIDEFGQWIESAQEVVDRLPRERARLEALEGRALSGPSTTEGAGWVFPATDAGRAEKWWHSNLTELVEQLEAFELAPLGLFAAAPDAISVAHGWSMPRRLEACERIARESAPGGSWAVRWEQARRSISTADAYSGLELEPIWGLVPIGRDRESGLWEFWHVLSGAEPRRSELGEIVVEDGSGVVLVLVPGGTFWMGAQADAPDAPNYHQSARENEGPVRFVTVAPFLLSKYELTQAQWSRLAGYNPSGFQGVEHGVDPRHPVEHVSWVDCNQVLDRFGLGMPSEAQWEYACRAGTQTPWSTGAKESSLTDGDAANIKAETVRLRHSPVGSFRPNAFGLHDMHGNVWEFCSDLYRTTPAEPASPAVEPGDSPTHPTRGGCFLSVPDKARSAYRDSATPTFHEGILGVRPALSLR